LTKQLAYLTDPLTLDFEAKIILKTPAADGSIDLILEKTYFYPTGGGQEYDTGTIGDAQVLDVFKDETGQVVHRVDRDVAGPVVAARVNGERRLGHMQHHTAQHLLSRTLEEVLGLETLSARISADTPSTIDVPPADLSPGDLERVEQFVSNIIFQNRPIKVYFINDAKISTVPFRRPPKVSGQIRVVEVEDFDWSACGGTHCLTTGTVGLIKIVKTEIKNKKLRIHFIAGRQALSYFQNYHRAIDVISRHFSTNLEEVTGLVLQQSEQLRATQRQLKRLQEEILPVEARRLAAQAEPIPQGRLVTALFPDRPLDQLRALAKLLQPKPDLVALLAGYDGRKLSLAVSCGEATGLSAKTLLSQQLAPIGGKGGGDDRLAQGGGEATAAVVEEIMNQMRKWRS
jgi:alanyl-tRNA synthetase